MFRRLYVLVLLLLPLVPARGGVASTPGGVVEGLQWQWEDGVSRRFYVQASVQLPGLMWLMANTNRDARMVSFGTRTVMTCTRTATFGRRSSEVSCVIDDWAIRGTPARGDKGVLEPILQEIDEKITGSTVQWVQRNDGRIQNVDLEGIPKRNRREARTHEAMRLIMARTIAPFDVELPKKGSVQGGVWGQYNSMLFAAPADTGSSGSIEIAHLIRSVDSGYAIIESAGRGMISPGVDGFAQNYYDTTLDSIAVFDLADHMLRERVWNCRGKPTASSAVSEGSEGVDYLQVGKILYLPEGVSPPDLGPTEETAPQDGQGDSAIFNWQPLNAGNPQ